VLPASAERVARTPVASAYRRRNFDYRLLGAGDEGALAAAGRGLATQALRLPRCLLAAELGEQGRPLVPAVETAARQGGHARLAGHVLQLHQLGVAEHHPDGADEHP